MNEKILAKDELIGKTVRITSSVDPSWTNRKGIIVDETKKTFIIEEENKYRRIAKNIACFEFKNNSKKFIIKGSEIIYRPEDRIKKVR
jgi:RNase P/RNase MRP subunit p29